MNNVDIKNVKVKFDTDPDCSLITFETEEGEQCGYLDLGDESCWLTENEVFEIEVGDWYDFFGGIYGDEATWKAEANKQLEYLGVKLGAYHDEPDDHTSYSGHYDLVAL